MSFLEQALEAIRRTKPRNVVFFTGAGVSAESGIPTFRGAGGLWRNFRAEDLATPEAFARASEAIRHADALLVIGTSGIVYPAAGLVSLHRGLSIEINPQASGVSSACTFVIPMTAAVATPPIVDAILEGQR